MLKDNANQAVPWITDEKSKQKFMLTRQQLPKENCLVFMCFSAISRVFCLLWSEWEKSIEIQRSSNSFFQRKRKVVAPITSFQLFSIIELKFNLVLALLVFSEATLSFIPSSQRWWCQWRSHRRWSERSCRGKNRTGGSATKYRKLFVRAQLKRSLQVEDHVPFIDGLLQAEWPCISLCPQRNPCGPARASSAGWDASGQRRIALAFNS